MERSKSLKCLGLLFCFLTLNSGSAKAPTLSGKELSFPPPRIIRTCCAFGSDLGVAGIPFSKQTDITSLANIGPHHYMGDKNEGNGNIYTHKGGFIDMGHLRDCADWTAYLYNVLVAGSKTLGPTIIDLGTEGGSKTLILNLPPGFSEKQALELAGKIAYDLSVWHEIATWFGASYIPLIPERYSSFSPEDLYSNLLGVTLAKKALKSDLEYDEAMTKLIAQTLADLEAVQTLEETYNAMETVQDIWWTRAKTLPSKDILITRYMGEGPNLVPWLVPSENCIPVPHVLKKPDARLNQYYSLTIRLNHKFPLKDNLNFPQDRVVTQNDFDKLMAYIITEEENRIR